jgi:hypothetical protein
MLKMLACSLIDLLQLLRASPYVHVDVQAGVRHPQELSGSCLCLGHAAMCQGQVMVQGGDGS